MLATDHSLHDDMANIREDIETAKEHGSYPVKLETKR